MKTVRPFNLYSFGVAIPLSLVAAVALLIGLSAGSDAADHRVAWDNFGGDNEFTNPNNWNRLDGGGHALPGYTASGGGDSSNAIIQDPSKSPVNLNSNFTPANFFSPLIVRNGTTLNINANLNIPGSGFLAGQTGTGNLVSQTAGTVTCGTLDLGNTTEAAGTSLYTITSGNLNASSLNILASGRLTVSGGSLGSGTISFNGGDMQFAGNVTVANAFTITTGQFGMIEVTSGNTGTITGAIDGGGNLNKLGTGTLVLTGANTYTGGTTVNAGTLSINGSGTIGSGTLAFNGGAFQIDRTVTMANAFTITTGQFGMIEVTSGNTGTITGAIDGGGNLNKLGTGTLTISNSKSYTGGTTFGLVNGSAAGTVVIQDSSALGTGAITFQAGGTLILGADALTVAGNVNVYNRADITARTIQLDLSGTNTGTLSGQIDIREGDANLFVADVGASDTLIFSGQLVTIAGGGAGITKTGAGTLRISSTDASYSGATTIDEGTLQIHNTSGSAAWVPGLIYINNGSTLEFTGTQQTIMQGTSDNITFDSGGGGSIVMTKNTIWRNAHIITTGGAKNTVSGSYFNGQAGGGGNRVIYDVAVGDDAVDLEVSSNHLNMGGITKNGAGTLALTSAANNMNGGTIIINDGMLEISGSGRLQSGSYADDITLNGDGIFKHSSDQVQTLSGNISGTGSLEKINGARLTLSGINNYSGTTTVGDGVGTSDSTLRAGSNTALSSNSAFIVNSDGTVELDGNSNSIGSLAGAAGGVVENANATTATLTTGGNNTSTTYAGVLRDGTGGGALALTKVGTGTQTLSGANTYTGATTINAGALELSGSGHINSTAGVIINGTTLRQNSSLPSTPPISFTASGGTLTGTGTIDASGYGGLSIGSQIVLSPGNSPGTQAYDGTMAWTNGGTYLWEINDWTGTPGADPGWDLIQLNGNLDLSALGSGNLFTIELASLTLANTAGLPANFDRSISTAFPILQSSFAISGFSPDKFTVDPSGFYYSASTASWSIYQQGNTLFLQYTAMIPEPTVVGLLGLGGLLLLVGRRLRRGREVAPDAHRAL